MTPAPGPPRPAAGGDSAAGCMIALGLVFLLAIAAVGGGVAWMLAREKARAKEAARAEAMRRAAEELAAAADAGAALGPSPFAWDAGAPSFPLAFDAGLLPGTPPAVVRVPIGTSPVRGPADALVTLVEFSDFQCPFCARVEPTIDKLVADYGADLRVVWKDEPLPFHTHAEPAAELAREARAQKGDTGFWRAHDALFADQRHLEDADLVALAGTLGLDGAKVATAIATHKHKAAIDADGALVAAVGASGTPTFFVNGRKVVGAQPYSEFKRVIDEELVKARALVGSGVPKANVYDAVTSQ